MKPLYLIVFALIAPLLSACGEASPPPTKDDLLISEGWVRKPLSGRDMSSGYLSLENTSGRELTLTEITSEHALRVEIHSTKNENGIARMIMQKELPIPPHAKVTLKPGGHHLMIFGIELAPNQGHMSFTLNLTELGKVDISLPIQTSSPDNSHAGH